MLIGTLGRATSGEDEDSIDLGGHDGIEVAIELAVEAQRIRWLIGREGLLNPHRGADAKPNGQAIDQRHRHGVEGHDPRFDRTVQFVMPRSWRLSVQPPGGKPSFANQRICRR